MNETARPGPHWPARAATTAIFLAHGLGVGAWATAIAPLQIGLALSAGALSFALLAVAAGAVAAMPMSGFFSARLGGSRPATRLASALLGLALALPGLAGGLAALVASAAVLGALIGVTDVVMNAHAAWVERQWRGAIMSSFHAAWSCGGLLGATLGGFLLHLGASPRGLLATAGLIVVAIALLAGRRLGEGDRGERGGPSFALPNRALIGLSLIALFALLTEGAMADWSAIYLTMVAGATPDRAASGYAVFALAMLVGRFAGDAIVRVFGRPRVIATGATLAGLGLALCAAYPSPAPILIGLAAAGLGLANAVPAVFSQAAMVGATPALGIAMASTVGYAGMLLGPPIVGAVATFSSLRVSFLVLVLAMAATLPIAASARKAEPPRSP